MSYVRDTGCIYNMYDACCMFNKKNQQQTEEEEEAKCICARAQTQYKTDIQKIVFFLTILLTTRTRLINKRKENYKTNNK